MCSARREAWAGPSPKVSLERVAGSLADVDEAGLANVRDAIEASKEPALAARSAADIPIGRYGRPEEYGSVVAFWLAFRRPT